MCDSGPDRGNDEPQADGNPDGRPRDNKVYDNDIYSGKEVAWLTTDADDNEFYVSDNCCEVCMIGPCQLQASGSLGTLTGRIACLQNRNGYFERIWRMS